MPVTSPEKKETIDDNARKFIVKTIHPQLLGNHGVSSFILTTDWLETAEDSEKKLAYKKFDDGDVQILLIAKVTTSGDRIAIKEKISYDNYNELLNSSVLRLEKKRYEFSYHQHDIAFAVKYDVFAGSALRLLEVDAASAAERNLFSPQDFPGELIEVTGDVKYYGYRIATSL